MADTMPTWLSGGGRNSEEDQGCSATVSDLREAKLKASTSWVLRRGTVATGMAALLAACDGFVGPHAPGTPCTEISEARFGALLDAGATRADAAIGANGIVSMTAGPGVVHCASGPMPRACRRPNEFVIRYTMANGTRQHVHVPAGSQYRFRVAASPTTCEIVAAP